MMKAVWSGVGAVAAVLVLSSSAFAQASANGSISVTANVAAKAKLTLGTASITFADADPDTTPTMTATAVSIDVKARASGVVTLTVLASGDLTAAGGDISNVSWVATPAPPFQNGTLSKTVAQRVASGTGNVPNPNTTGLITFRLANSWTYSTGTYTQTVLFTLSAP
jgi:hypothetical protein